LRCVAVCLLCNSQFGDIFISRISVSDGAQQAVDSASIRDP